MVKRVLIIKNVTREGPGLFKTVLQKNKIPYEIIDFGEKENFPSLKNYGALVVLGGPDSANDNTKKIKTEIKKVQESLSLKLPYLGICLGLQILVKAAGGQVIKSPIKEIGFRGPTGKVFKVNLTQEGQKDPLFKELGNQFNVFHLHGETVKLTRGMKLLARGEFCHNQIVKVGTHAYGIQCHFELTSAMFNKWLNKDPDLLKLNKEKLISDFTDLQDKYREIGQRLFRNFLHIANFPISL